MNTFLKKLLAFVLIASAGLLVVECAARLMKIPHISHHDIVAKSQTLLPQVDSNTIVFLGDSRVEWGVKPIDVRRELNDQEPLTVINMALPGSNGLDAMTYLKQNDVHPKLMVLGLSGNIGRWNNHELDRLQYTKANAFFAKLKYRLVNSLFIADRSIINFYRHGTPLFKSHTYDDWGGVIVTENGDYTERKKYQVRNYTGFRKSLSTNRLERYIHQVNKLIQHFKENGPTRVLGLYMPVCPTLYEIETLDDELNSIRVDRLLDLHGLYDDQPDESTYFYDCSHLAHKQSSVFSVELAKMLRSELGLAME